MKVFLIKTVCGIYYVATGANLDLHDPRIKWNGGTKTDIPESNRSTKDENGLSTGHEMVSEIN